MSYKIVKNKDFLRVKTTKVATLEEGQEIAIKLMEALGEIGVGIGLSANQIGIQKSVSIVHVRKDKPPIVLINPVITETSKEQLVYVEGCLSMPGKQANTLRKAKITVSTLNSPVPLIFGPDTNPVTNDSIGSDYGIMESVCVQHEIDHLNGMLMTDVRYSPPKQVEKKYGRNDKVLIEKGGETAYVKYKKAQDLINDGWKIL